MKKEILDTQRYPTANRGTVVVWSLIASHPFPGTAWHRLQYLAGLRRLGFDVWYVEDSDRLVRNPTTWSRTTDFAPNVEYLAHNMELIGLGDRWIFRPPGQYAECMGARSMSGLMDLYRSADLVVNHSGAQELRQEHACIRRLLYLETDPVVNQVEVAQGESWIIETLSAHHHLFTYAENIGSPDCQLPIERFEWIPTRPALCVDWWMPANVGTRDYDALTTVATWKHTGNDVIWRDRRWSWSKHHEFLKFVKLPDRSKLPLELAVGGIDEIDRALLARQGWRTTPARKLNNLQTYRDYIRSSLGEFTATKEQYVAPRSGWFSDRSSSYLASGRPVITQDTGFSNVLPTGEGLFAFSTPDEAIAAIDAVATDYGRNASAALEIAYEYFSAERVIGESLRHIGLL